MKKRIMAIIILVCILIISSCSVDSSSLLSFLPSDSELGIDFEGYSFCVLTPEGSTAMFDPLTDGGSSSARSVWSDALVSWNKYIQETYNCVIETDTCPVVYKTSSTYARHIAAGTAKWSLINANIIDVLNLYEGGLLHAWSDTSLDIDNHEKFGGEIYMKGAEFKGKKYGVVANYWSSGQNFNGMIISNNTLLKDYVSVNVHELKESGKWTFEEFKKILEACTVDIGKTDKVIPLTNYSNRILPNTCVMANGGQVVDYDESTNKYSYGLTSPKAVKGLEYSRSLYDAKLCNHSVENGANFWENGDSVFNLTCSSALGVVMNVFDDIDVINFPYGPDVEYGSVSTSYIQRDSGYILCPITADAELTAKFITLWFEQFPDYSKNDMIEEFKNTMFYNEESMEEYFLMEQNVGYNYYAQFGDLHEKLDMTLANLSNGPSTIMEELEKTRHLFEERIETFFNDN